MRHARQTARSDGPAEMHYPSLSESIRVYPSHADDDPAEDRADTAPDEPGPEGMELGPALAREPESESSV